MRYETLTVLALLGKSFSRPLQAQGITTDAATFAQSSFDYIIVGGGTAGLTLAARLSEDPAVNVGVIEAGQPRFDESAVNTPATFGQAMYNPAFDWILKTVPQATLNGRSVVLNQGKMLGGSSALNFMVWQRGSRGDYDSWGELGVGGGWDWDGLLPYFLKTENAIAGPSAPFGFPDSAGEGSERGRSGPLPVGYNNFYSEIEGPYAETLLSKGVPKNADPDNGDSTGFFNAGASVDHQTGNRSYSARNYLLPNTERPNLAVLVGAQATKIEFSSAAALNEDDSTVGIQTPFTFAQNGSVSTAAGVQFAANDATFTVLARKEVILSAGSIRTPQLLELSGIGNQARLSALDIPVIFNNPAVGENFQDHSSLLNKFSLANADAPTIATLFLNESYTTVQEQLYLNNHTGPFTYTVSALSFHPLQQFWDSVELDTALSRLQSEIDQANIDSFTRKQFQLQIDSIRAGKLGQMELIFSDISYGLEGPVRGMVELVNIASRQFSRGNTHINSTDPFATPLIDPAYLQFSIDKQVLAKGARILRELSQTAPLSNYISSPVSPSKNVITEEDFENFVTENAGTQWHPVGTASLGPLGEGGVVDDNLVVYGTSNVRVVDASIVPMQIGAHIQATIYAIAEKASDIIKVAQ